jgi:hypothetical protein
MKGPSRRLFHSVPPLRPEWGGNKRDVSIRYTDRLGTMVHMPFGLSPSTKSQSLHFNRRSSPP